MPAAQPCAIVGVLEHEGNLMTEDNVDAEYGDSVEAIEAASDDFSTEELSDEALDREQQARGLMSVWYCCRL